MTGTLVKMKRPCYLYYTDVTWNGSAERILHQNSLMIILHTKRTKYKQQIIEGITVDGLRGWLSLDDVDFI